MSRRRIWTWLIATAILVPIASWQSRRHLYEYVFAEKYLVVEPGKLYRGAWQRDWPMRRIIRNDRIKTIVALAHPPEHPLAIREAALSKEMGVRWIHLPVVEESTTIEGHRTVADALEKAADAMADPANQPVYFHCHHGVNRTSMAQMAYRMLHCGYTLHEAEAEIARTPIGLVEVNHGVDYRYMATFYRERVLPRRQALAARKAIGESTPR